MDGFKLGGNVDSHRSTTGYNFTLGSGAISWSSKKQTYVALSIMKSEFIALSSTVQEGVWLKRFLDHLKVTFSKEPVTIMSDSQSSITYTKDPKFHSKTKHINIKYHYVKNMVARREVNLKYISTNDMIADSLTKAVTRDVFERHIKYFSLHRF